ncbi:GH39 family glycosyl hydrolase [Spirosoma endbachense]|uniref:Cellulase family glycosylhydrolase n=1 Tax=Spirosoma endbachense TaxID=2666025 RepID=A0A6P1W9I0_9BACT|nr:cellulase family glycosylhydrolase [Spirosoma endbachense]QHW00377.1 cellulase family glycosylhydrolase [Spirosoma endbachense]
MKSNSLNIAFATLCLLVAPKDTVIAQNIDTGKGRVKTSFNITLPYLGSIKPRSTSEIKSSNWLIGCETMDRDFTDYDQYKEYLVPLGIKRLRMQAGWDKTEKIKAEGRPGQYDWAWLDHIIDDAHKRGLKPWLQTSYGNHNYPNGGGSNLGAGVPTSKEALEAWDKWVDALVTRYKSKVVDWEIWNEPNFGDNQENTPEKAAALNIRTIDIIKRIQPEAKVSGLALGHISLDYADRYFRVLAEKKKINLFNNFTYHDYTYNPDSHYPKVMQLRAVLDKYAPDIPLRQGENGAPSSPGFGRGALGDYEWSELTQAKWDTRRMLGDLGHDIETSVFGIIEMAYTNGPINRLNYKGIIKSDSTKKAIRPKIAYYAIQNVTAIFDHSLQRIKKLEHTYNRAFVPENKAEMTYSPSTDRSLAVYAYQHKDTKKQVFTIWANDYIPVESNATRNLSFSFANANIDTPVYVDIITGGVYEIPASQWKKTGAIYTFTDIPIYDAPILIADKSLVKFQ